MAVTFLLVVGEDVAFQIMESLSTDHLKDCMGPTMDKTSYLLNYIFPLIQRLHPPLCEFLDRYVVELYNNTGSLNDLSRYKKYIIQYLVRNLFCHFVVK